MEKLPFEHREKADNEEIRDILQSEDISQPEQNRSSEREFRAVVEMTGIFNYSGHKASFLAAVWAELVLNRTEKPKVEGVSPYKL
ncbi:hypothetical protein ILUMI_15733 [Ignelater luminosus]|uniref:Uncharacterized protein n=1 Tax=Ignelater luminosus TaxID=2038154 RepID=A0A8K0CVV7_IGNLU|nr:hypothetical protein ILUMI_15733 [Ignelater luminosus]